jgi:hypothetical protein
VAEASWFIGLLINEDVDDDVAENRGQVKYTPKAVTKSGVSFIYLGRTGSMHGGRKIQFIIAPAVIAPKVRNNIGIDTSLSLS